MASSSTILMDTAEFSIIRQLIDEADGGEILHLVNAKTVYIHSTAALDYKLPKVAAHGGAEADGGTWAPVDTTDAINIDMPTGEGLIEPTASQAGMISESMMPLFLQLAHGSTGAQATVYIYIIKRS
tara:strand:- start:6485 stop:6865 length:381 start_codon:yes stop_codon:yes gene_type:complete